MSGAFGSTSVDAIKGKAVSPGTYSAGQVLRYDGTKWVNAQINLSTDVTGVLPLTQGGTGASTQSAAINNLLPTQSGNTNKFLQTSGTAVLWADAPVTGMNALTGDVTATGTGTVSATVQRIQGRSIATATPANGQVLKWNGASSMWEPFTDSDSGGTVTNVMTGTGLTGGPITTTGTIAIATGGVGTAQLADGSVTNTKIASVDASKLTTGTIPVARLPVLTCPTDFDLVTSGSTAFNPFCISISYSTTSVLNAAGYCAQIGADLCSSGDLAKACSVGKVPLAASLWATGPVVSNYALYFTGSSCLGFASDLATNLKNYRCCWR